MHESEAVQIATMLNNRNQLTKQYTADMILKDQDKYIYETDKDIVIGCVEIKKVQWYQAEICHLTVHENYEGHGQGRSLINKAIESSKKRGVRILQCTIRDGNIGSENLFTSSGFSKTSSFYNLNSGNNVSVYQKSICVAR